MEADVDVTVDSKRFALETEGAITQAWLNHPLAVSVLDDFKTQEEAFVDLICNNRVVDIGTLVAHFEAVGHLRGLRYATQRIYERRDEINEELKKLQ